MKFMIPAALFVVLLSACQKKSDTAPDITQVQMTVSSPRAGQTFRAGDTVFINAVVAYPGELHGYEVKITDSASGQIVYDQAQHIHTDNFTISDKWITASGQSSSYKLSLITSIDHDGDDARKEVNFKIIP